jgi:hypothetical protein
MYFNSKYKLLPVLPKWKSHPYKVIPIPVLVVEHFPRGLFTYLLDYDKTFDLYCGAFFISGVEGYNILIDSGPSREDFEAGGFSCQGILPMPEALKQATGREPEDIDIIFGNPSSSRPLCKYEVVPERENYRSGRRMGSPSSSASGIQDVLSS